MHLIENQIACIIRNNHTDFGIPLNGELNFVQAMAPWNQKGTVMLVYSSLHQWMKKTPATSIWNTFIKNKDIPACKVILEATKCINVSNLFYVIPVLFYFLLNKIGH